eukprot:4991136-Pleurochrysis_carterae.AAC.1
MKVKVNDTEAEVQQNATEGTWSMMMLKILGICLERPSGAGWEMTISTTIGSQRLGSERRRGGWAHLRGGSGNRELS